MIFPLLISQLKWLAASVVMGLLVSGCGELAGAGAAGGGRGPVERAAGGSAGGSARERQLAGELFEEVNGYRRSRGRAGLERHGGLDRLAQAHSEYMRSHRGTFSLSGKNISHIGFESRVMAAKQYYEMENVSENLIAGNRPGGLSARQMVEEWKTSAGHHRNMWDRWEYTGVGVVVDSDGHVFATQIYATRAVKTSRWSGPQVTF
jgi:uncharacterized protein YkwD